MSDQNQSSQEKSHEASPRKLERARKKGELARSQDAQTAAAYLGFAAAMLVGGAWAAMGVGETLAAFLARPGELVALMRGDAAPAISLQIFKGVAGAVIPILIFPALLILALLFAQRAVIFAPEKLKPKLSRISPIQNAKQKYGPHGLMEFLKAAIKLTAVAAVLGFALLAEFDSLLGYVRVHGRYLPMLLETQFWNMVSGILILAFAVAMIDVVWQRHSHLKRMRMTHQEMKDEAKQSDGDPHFRATRRERAREIANNRMLHDVPKADVVIVNPTHFAVALKWSRATKSVPVCVAKGQDEMARRIRTRAEQAGVPIHSDPPTARSIHALIDVGKPIHPDHYKAAAAAIIFADKIRAKQRERDSVLGGP